MRLTAICTIYPGYTARTRLEPALVSGVLAIQLRDISPEGAIDLARLARINLDPAPDRYMVRPGDVVFRSRGTWTTASAVTDALAEPALAVMPLFILRPNRAVVTPEYLAWAINQPPAQRHFDSKAQGASMRMVPKSSLDDLELDIPDLASQGRLVAIDDLAERARVLAVALAEKRRQLTTLGLIERANLLAQSPKKSGARK